MAKKSTALAKAAKNNVSLFDDQATGLEHVQQKDLIIPMITILQDLSPQTKRNSPEYIKGAESGMICDKAMSEVFEDTIKILPVFFTTSYIEWEPNRGGFVANHGNNSNILEHCVKTPDQQNPKRIRDILQNGNEIVEHHDWYFMNLTAGGRQSYMSLSVTQTSASRKLISAIYGQKLVRDDGTKFTPPMWYRSWDASISEATKGNDSWFVWNFSPAETVVELDESLGLLAEAKEFNETVASGRATGERPEAEAPAKEEAM
jgi:hypothetical protein